jgi:DNA-binding MarR family transcriptional regulator
LLEREAERELAGLDVTPAQVTALVVLARVSERTMGELAWELGMTESATTRLIDRLVRTGLVRRARDVSDRRVVRVRLSPYGRQLVDVVLARRQARFERTGSHMAAADRDALLKGLDALLQAWESLQHEDPEATE